MELKHIKELMAAMGRYGTKRLEYRKDGVELVLEREFERVFEPSQERISHTVFAHPSQHKMDHAFSHGGEISSTTSQKEDKAKKEKTGNYIESPMVGTFYSSSSPDSASFIKIGERVEKETVVCIIEAMKVMNEVKAGISGVVAEICVSNGDPVEFGTPLFRVIES